MNQQLLEKPNNLKINHTEDICASQKKPSVLVKFYDGMYNQNTNYTKGCPTEKVTQRILSVELLMIVSSCLGNVHAAKL